MQLEQSSTHKSAKTYAGTVFVPHDLDLHLLTQNKLTCSTHHGTFTRQVWWSQLHWLLRRHRQTAVKTLRPRLPTTWVIKSAEIQDEMLNSLAKGQCCNMLSCVC